MWKSIHKQAKAATVGGGLWPDPQTGRRDLNHLTGLTTGKVGRGGGVGRWAEVYVDLVIDLIAVRG